MRAGLGVLLILLGCLALPDGTHKAHCRRHIFCAPTRTLSAELCDGDIFLDFDDDDSDGDDVVPAALESSQAPAPASAIASPVPANALTQPPSPAQVDRRNC